MAPLLLSVRHGPSEGSSEPLSGIVISVALSMLSASALSAFTTQRYLAINTWKQLPLVQWLVFAIYTDSFLFVLATGILQFGFGVGYSGEVCESAILLCLIFYVTTKFIYLFLVEKAYIIRSGNKKPRLKSKLYCFNSFGMIGAYCVVVVPNFVLRFARVENGECIIGMQRPAMIPLIVFDLLVNVYLTIIFLKPLSGLYSYKNSDRIPGSRKLKTMAVRTFIGCVCTLISSIVNLSVLVGLNGEPGWVCLMCCNSDILFSAVVIHWVTSRDSTTTTAPDDTIPASSPRNNHKNNTATHLSSAGDELSAIPPRAARQRLPSSSSSGDCCCAAGDDHTLNHDQKHEQADIIINSITTTNNNNMLSPRKSDHRRRSHLSITTTADAPGTLPRPSGDAKEERGGDISPSCTCSDGTPKPPFGIFTTNGHHDDRDYDDDEAPSLGAAARERERQQRATSEVRVDVDYGATTTTVAAEGEGGGEVRLGNTVVIGVGRGKGGWRWR